MALALKLTRGTKTRRSAVPLVENTAATAAATAYREAHIAMDNAKTKLATAKEELMKVVTGIRDTTLRAGKVENVKVATKDGSNVMVVYSEAYRGLTAENVPALMEALGDDYPVLCDETAKVALAKGTGLEAIEAAIGKAAMKKLMPLLDVTEQVVPRKGAYKAAANLFLKGEGEKAEDLLTLVEACASSPSVRAK